jgi:glycosyltransferase involved in cell wall biosynthesis
LLTFENSNSSYSSGKLEFVTCSRLTGWKRIDRAIKFIAAIKRKSTILLHLTIIGEGNERPNLEKLAKEEGVSEDISFTGGMEYNKAIQCISAHKIYIVFNDLSNLGNQIYEAICLGLIPVTIDDGSTDSILQNGVNAIKIPLSDSFGDNAADIFLQVLSEDKLSIIFDNVGMTKELLFTWRQRNKMEQDFLSLNCDNRGFGG